MKHVTEKEEGKAQAKFCDTFAVTIFGRFNKTLGTRVLT
jgi:hypothetical protein